MSNKYQVFVSSTYIDLKEHRDLVIKAVLEMGHIPVGMEMFSAADEEQWAIIKRQIDQSDYYVVVLANRYGSVTEEGTSYTEKEYDYAVKIGLPTLGFVLDQDSSWPSKFTDTETEAVSKMDLFKSKVKQKHISFWKNEDDLYGKCSIALMKAFNAYPREGWVRASKITDIKFTGELARLSAENAELRKTIEEYQIAEKEEKQKENTDIINILDKNERTLHVWTNNANEWEKIGKKSLYSIFIGLGPELLVEKSIRDMSSFIALILSEVGQGNFRDNFPVPSNSVKSWMADFSTLGLVKPSSKKKPVSDTNEYWTLTEKGKEILASALRSKLEKAIVQEEPPEAEEIDS